MADGLYSLEEIVKVFKTKVDEASTLFYYLSDDVKEEVWKYWQEVTNTLHNAVSKIKKSDKLQPTDFQDVNQSTDHILLQNVVFEPNTHTSSGKNIISCGRPDDQFLPPVNNDPRQITPISSQHSQTPSHFNSDSIQLHDIAHLTSVQNEINFDLLRDENSKFLAPEYLQHTPYTSSSHLQPSVHLRNTGKIIQQLDDASSWHHQNESSVNISTPSISTPNINFQLSKPITKNSCNNNIIQEIEDVSSWHHHNGGIENISSPIINFQPSKSITNSSSNQNIIQEIEDAASWNQQNESSVDISAPNINFQPSKPVTDSTCDPIISNELDSEINFFSIDNPTTEKVVNENKDGRKYPLRKRGSAKNNSLYTYSDLTAEADKDDKVVKKDNKENKKKRKKVEKSSDGSVTCDICGIRLARAASMIAHKRQHTGDRPFQCSECGRGFTTKANKIRHENTHKGIKPFKCPECSQCFAENKTLQTHMLRHSGEKPHKCPVCGEGFTQRGTLQHHMYRHTGHKGHLCDLCGKSFRQKTQLHAHQRRHQKKRTFKCDFCDKSFCTKGDLVRHTTKHTNIRPFICDTCPKTFTRLQYLKEHQNFHRGIKPHVCKECNEAFYEASALYRHMKRHKAKEDGSDNKQQKQQKKQKPQKQQKALLLTEDGREYQIPVVTTTLNNVLDGETQFADVYQITYLEQTMNNVNGPTALQTQPDLHSTTVTDMSDTSHITPSIVAEADFSAINLLANATTQLIH